MQLFTVGHGAFPTYTSGLLTARSCYTNSYTTTLLTSTRFKLISTYTAQNKLLNNQPHLFSKTSTATQKQTQNNLLNNQPHSDFFFSVKLLQHRKIIIILTRTIFSRYLKLQRPFPAPTHLVGAPVNLAGFFIKFRLNEKYGKNLVIYFRVTLSAFWLILS